MIMTGGGEAQKYLIWNTLLLMSAINILQLLKQKAKHSLIIKSIYILHFKHVQFP